MTSLRKLHAPCVTLARLGIGVLFAWAAVGKIADPAAFGESIENYHLVPESLVPSLASVLPVVELTIATSLLVGIWIRGSALVAGLLLLGFTVGMGQALARGINLECGCFGAAAAATVGWTSIARNLLLMLASALVATAPEHALGWRFLRWRATAAVSPAQRH